MHPFLVYLENIFHDKRLFACVFASLRLVVVAAAIPVSSKLSAKSPLVRFRCCRTAALFYRSHLGETCAEDSGDTRGGSSGMTFVKCQLHESNLLPVCESVKQIAAEFSCVRPLIPT